MDQYDENIYTDANGYYKKILDGEPAWVNVQVRNINKGMNPLLQQNNYVAVVDFINELFCNNPPTCSNSSQTTYLGQAITKPVGSFDPDGDNLTFSLVNQPSSGSVDLYNRDATNGEYVYTPGTATGNITFTYNVTDSKGASSGNCTVTINVKPLPVITVNSASICVNAQATLTASGCSRGTVTWSNGSSDSSITVSPNATTNYTATCNLNGCTGSGTGTVFVNYPANISVNSKAICPGGMATLTASSNERLPTSSLLFDQPFVR
ncbi:Ig-like domain-containing protein [Spirosoma pulveris]